MQSPTRQFKEWSELQQQQQMQLQQQLQLQQQMQLQQQHQQHLHLSNRVRRRASIRGAGDAGSECHANKGGGVNARASERVSSPQREVNSIRVFEHNTPQVRKGAQLWTTHRLLLKRLRKISTAEYNQQSCGARVTPRESR
ncbi:hypothetical protein FHG87_009522 [Trinorchestia longiramus]|nr:hypothetical protein FHG87_009522 [Trinorchestia longiramus]